MNVFRRALALVSLTGYADDPRDVFARVRDMAVAAEQAGFDALLVPDHVILPPIAGGPDAPIFEAYTFLGALAARTESLRLGSLVSPITLRHPAFLTKQVTTLDVLSGGRAILGVGAGWDASEHAAYGIPFPALGERMDRLDETLSICRAMFREPTPSFSGEHYSIREAYNVPRPLSDVPVIVGGTGERRTLAIVARHADACNVAPDPETIARKFSVLAEHCHAIGRDPSEIQKTVTVAGRGDLEQFAREAEAMVALGVEGIAAFATPDLAVMEASGKILLDLLP